jgi:hypothetical protein
MELLLLTDNRKDIIMDSFKNVADLKVLTLYLLLCNTVKSGISLQLFRGTECLHLQSRRKIQASSDPGSCTSYHVCYE